MERRIESEQLLEILELFKSNNCNTLEDARELIVKKKVFYEKSDFVINLLGTSDKIDFLIKNLEISVKDEPDFPYEKIIKIEYSEKNQRVKFVLSDNKVINKKEEDVDFDLKKIKGAEFFHYVS